MDTSVEVSKEGRLKALPQFDDLKIITYALEQPFRIEYIPFP